MNEVMKIEMDTETQDVIWRHLLTLSAIVNGSSRAKDLLKEKASAKSSAQLVKFEGEGKEEDFLNTIISKVEQQVTGDVSDPQQAISSLMSSNLIPELVSNLNSGISSGSLDLGKMISSVQKMVGNMSGGDAASDPGIANAMGMLNNMMGMMNTGK
jgi:hypothetical protein